MTTLKEKLILDGKVYNVTVGDAGSGGDVSPITGGGAGTTVDSDQPELAIGVDRGYRLIPLRVKVSGHVDMDANAEDGDAIAFLDLTQAPVADTETNKTGETPQNLLDDPDGGDQFPGRAYSAVTADITDPVVTALLDAVHIQGSDNGTAGNLAVTELNLDWEGFYVAEGPCQLVVCWGGVAAVPGMCTVEVAAVPSDYDLSQL